MTDPQKIARAKAQKKWNEKNLLKKREYARQRRKDKPEETRKYWARWYSKHPARKLLTQIKSRAIARGIPFDLSENDIAFPEICPILGIAMNYSDRKSPGYRQLDRIVPSKGYIKGNVMLVSARANRLKLNGTAEEHMKIAAYIQMYGTETR